MVVACEDVLADTCPVAGEFLPASRSFLPYHNAYYSMRVSLYWCNVLFG